MKRRRLRSPIAVRGPLAGTLALALASAACGSPAPSSPPWSFAALPTTTPGPSAVARSTAAAAASASPAPPSATTPASALPADGLATTCAGQWAAEIVWDESAVAGGLDAVLFRRTGIAAPAVEPTAAILQTDKGPLDLTVTGVSSDESETPAASTRLSFGLPVLKAGAYRAQFLDITDATGTWRFRVGDISIRVVPGSSAPGVLIPGGQTIETGAFEGGSVQGGFEVQLQNTTAKGVVVTGASTDIPGLPVTWILAEPNPPRIVTGVAIAPGTTKKIFVGSEDTARPVHFVLAQPEMLYRVAAGPVERLRLEPIVFTIGFGQPSDSRAYAATLPSDACAQRP